MMALNTLGVEFIEVVSSKIVGGLFVAQDMVRDDKNVVGDGQDRFVLATSPSKTMIRGIEVVVPRTRDHLGALS